MSSSSTSSSPRRSRRRAGNPQDSPMANTPSDSGSLAASSPLPYGGSTSNIPSSAPETPGVQTSSPLPYASTPGSVSSLHSASHLGSPRRALGASHRVREVVDPSSAVEGPRTTSEGSNPLARYTIWGTGVNVQETQDRFLRFLRGHRDINTPADAPSKYLRLIDQMEDTAEWFVDIDCHDLIDFDEDLYERMVRYPQEVINAFDSVLDAEFERRNARPPDASPQVRPFNLRDTVAMRSLNPEDVDQLVAIRGMVIRVSPVIPDPSEGFFQCTNCSNGVRVGIDRGKILEPSVCNNCQMQKSFRLVHNRCTFADKQMIKLQETPDKVPDGQTPQTVLAFAYDTLVDAVQPGDLIELTGVYRATPLRLNPRQRTVKSVFKTHIDVLHFREKQRYRIGKEDEEEDHMLDPRIVEERNRKLVELSKKPDIIDRLVQAVAPNIFGFELVKRGVLAMLFGGTHKKFEQRARGKFRGEINVLLCGDPGTSKSQLLQYAVKLAPRGMYTSGKGSSAVGLTAYVTKDPETKQVVLESGALVLCDGGVCCIDEFDKMPDTTRSILHEVMEQQTVSIAKAGIIASLNARTSILAAANPQESTWNKRLSIVDNIQLPPTLLSRFDLIYLILDTPDRAKDRLLARHIVALYYKDQDRNADADLLNRETLAQYISYARKTVRPQLTEDASRDLIQEYVTLRKLGNQRKMITATPRQLESLIRLAEAHAKMRFSSTVERSDVEMAVTLMKEALQQAATDPVTGLLDMDLINTGQSMSTRHRLGDLTKAITDLMIERKIQTLQFSALLNMINEQSSIPVKPDELRSAVDHLETDEFLKVIKRDGRDFTFRVIAPSS
eukprot:m.127344 g.127344  ORF g.127344 m.127344 type:complete len:841 (-) comp15655_c3_seq1:57-2579(-)